MIIFTPKCFLSRNFSNLCTIFVFIIFLAINVTCNIILISTYYLVIIIVNITSLIPFSSEWAVCGLIYIYFTFVIFLLNIFYLSFCFFNILYPTTLLLDYSIISAGFYMKVSILVVFNISLSIGSTLFGSILFFIFKDTK